MEDKELVCPYRNQIHILIYWPAINVNQIQFNRTTYNPWQIKSLTRYRNLLNALNGFCVRAEITYRFIIVSNSSFLFIFFHSFQFNIDLHIAPLNFLDFGFFHPHFIVATLFYFHVVIVIARQPRWKNAYAVHGA